MPKYETGVGTSDATSITLLGEPIEAMMRGTSFSELAFRLGSDRVPTSGELKLFDAALVSLADHGLTPTAIAARLTLYSAPEALQGALAAGLLGGGSRFLGVTEDTATFLKAVIDPLGSDLPKDDGAWDVVASAAVRDAHSRGARVPGLGHPVHKAGDPRIPVIFDIAEKEGVMGAHLTLFRALGRSHPKILGKTLPLNGAGAAGAALCDLGLPAELLRGYALLARTAGLIGHLREEMRRPLGPAIYHDVDRNAQYVPLPNRD